MRQPRDGRALRPGELRAHLADGLGREGVHRHERFERDPRGLAEASLMADHCHLNAYGNKIFLAELFRHLAKPQTSAALRE